VIYDLLKRERFKGLLVVNIMEHFSFHGAGGECHGCRDMRTSKGGLGLGGDAELTWRFVNWSSDMQVGATANEKFIVLSFRVKIQGLFLIVCDWQCSC
jgi:hypothetical protein